MTDLRKHNTAEKIAVSDVCDEKGIQPSVFYRWQQQVFENGAAAFGPHTKGPTNPLTQKVSALEEKLTRKNQVLSELMEEYVKQERQRSWRKQLGGV